MKTFTLFTMMVALSSVTAFAQKDVIQRPWQGTVHDQSTTINCIERKAQPAMRMARQLTSEDVLVTPPATATVEQWYTISGSIYVNTSSGMKPFDQNVNVAIDGDDIYIQGLAYWFPDGWIKGAISGSTATFPGGQFVGSDDYGPEYICASDDGETLTENIVFNYKAEEGLLESVTAFILENSVTTEVSVYCYWVQPTFSKKAPEAPQVVVAPEDLKTDEWAISAVDNFDDPVSGYVNIGFDGNDVYMQGLCTYLPEAWIKGTLEGTTITFAGDQYFGPYDSYYDHYEFFLRSEGVVFNYDAEAGKMTAKGEIYIYTDNLKGDVYNDPVLTKVFDKAATPATPYISQIYEATSGHVVMFTVPTTDVNGEAMASSKLSFQFYKDVETEISPVTFDPAEYMKLSESMTVIPYGYTDEYDFYPEYIYLNQADYNTWNKIGIQSIYTGGGEENRSEIYWLSIKEYAKTTFDFNAMTDEPCSSGDDNSGDINEDRVITENGVTLTISPKTEEASTPNRFWSTKNGPQLRVYSGTLTFEAPVGKVISKIVFNAGKWNNGNSADSGAFEGSVWTGEAQKVVVTIAGNTQLNSIEVYPVDYVPTAVVAPEGLVAETYIFQAHSEKPYYEPEELTLWTNGGFDGDDFYIQGLTADYNSSTAELWAKATRNEAGQYVIPANQFMGSVEFWMSNVDCYITAVDAEGNMTDIVFNFDADKAQFTTDQTVVINNSSTALDPQQTFTGITITKFNEVAATPADPTIVNLDFGEWSHSLSCNIPTVGSEGETLNPQKLFYTIWLNKEGAIVPYTFTAQMYYAFDEDTTEVPYSQYYSSWDNAHNIYFYDDEEVFASWWKVGVQSIYYGGGEVRKSNIVWTDTPFVVGIDDINVETCSTVIFNTAGQRTYAPMKGLNIINGRKVMIK